MHKHKYNIPKNLQPWLRVATVEDACSLASRMREVDMQECLLAGHTPLQALSFGLGEELSMVFTHPQTGVVHAMFGVAQDHFIWLLADDILFVDPTMKRLLTRNGRELLQLLFEEGGVNDILYNITFKRNTKVLRWLSWLGASVGQPFHLGGQEVLAFSFFRSNYTHKKKGVEKLCATQ